MVRHREFLFLARALSPSRGDERVGALREEIARAQIVWPELVELASQQLVTPTLHQALREKDLLDALPAEVREYLEAVHTLNRERNRRIADQTVEIAAALDRTGIEPVLLKGVAHLFADLYGDPAARIIGDIDLLVSGQDIERAGASLTAIGYRTADVGDMSFAEHHHLPPLVRADAVAAVELHSEPLFTAFGNLLPAAELLAAARPVAVADRQARMPAPRHQMVLNIAHAQLADRHYWSGRVSLRALIDLVLLRARADDATIWPGILDAFEGNGYGDACRAYLMLAERLLGQATPPGLRPTLAARLACRRVEVQRRSPRLMALGASYGFYRAMLAQLAAGPLARRRVLNRVLHPAGYRRWLRSWRQHVGRTG